MIGWFIILTLVTFRSPEVYSHLKRTEGYKRVGYIPTAQSGVTIATGIDLGQQTYDGLKARGIPDGLLQKLKPYVGLKTEADVEKAQLKPENLKLTDDEADQLNGLFVKEALDAITPYSRRMSDKGTAVLVSLKYWAGHLGSDSQKLAPEKVNYVWDAIKDKTANTDDLLKALQALQKDHEPGSSSYNRIKNEIDYLQKP